jgi:hypothetical protein
MPTATIYDLHGHILRDNVIRPNPAARRLATRLHTSVIVEDWDRARRYRVTSRGRIHPPPRDWIPASAWTPEPSLRLMRREPDRFARELKLHRIDVLMRAKYRAWFRQWRATHERAKRKRPDLYS